MSSHTRQKFRPSSSCIELYSTALSAVPGGMFSNTRQRLLLYQVECRVALDSAFCSRTNVVLQSIELSALPSRMSSHIRQLFPTFQVECRVTLDSSFRCSRSNVESHSTALSALPGRMLSHTRQPFLFQIECRIIQRFPLFEVEFRVTLDSVFRCCRSNVGSHSTALSRSDVESLESTIGPYRSNVKSHSVEIPSFQFVYRVIFDSAFRPFRSIVESQSTALFVVPGRKSSHSTAQYAVPGRMSSHPRQRFPPFEVEC